MKYPLPKSRKTTTIATLLLSMPVRPLAADKNYPNRQSKNNVKAQYVNIMEGPYKIITLVKALHSPIEYLD